MTVREDLHSLVEWLPECAWEDAQRTLLEHLKKHDPLAYALYTAPEEDPEEDELEALAEAEEEMARGEPAITDDQLRKTLGL